MCFRGVWLLLGPVFLLVGGCTIAFISSELGLFMVVAAPISFIISFIEALSKDIDEQRQEYEDFLKRVKVRNPDRVRRVWNELSPAGRTSIQNHEQFLEDERLLFPQKA